uniref:Uncharacterized protein n=1 Tax=Oryza glaberrima TaxID=4538 RepID=I1R6X0_ORYGL
MAAATRHASTAPAPTTLLPRAPAATFGFSSSSMPLVFATAGVGRRGWAAWGCKRPGQSSSLGEDGAADELKEQLQGALQENGQLKRELQQYTSEKKTSAKTTDAADAAAEQAEQWRKATETAMAAAAV